MLKDYYKILQCPPNASQQTLKKQYRILAIKYHPDTNPNNADALLNFNLIKEAYETLSQPHLKQQYLNQKWYAKSKGVTIFNSEALTADVLLKTTLAIEQYVATANNYMLNKFAITKQIKSILTTQNCLYLNLPDNNFAASKIATSILKIINSLKVENIKNLLPYLTKLDALNSVYITKIINAKTKLEFLETYTLPFIIVVSVVILFFIFSII